MLPLVSVIIPTYNGAKYIRDALESVLEQSYPNIEIIVMDGASEDGTAEIARSVAPHAIVISEPDRGQAHAINKGWAMAKGNIVTWLCADDGYYPDTVANAVEYLQSHPDAMWVYGLADHLDENGDTSPMRHPVTEWNYQLLRDWADYIIQPSTFLRKQVIQHKGMLNEQLHYVMDYEYWLRIGTDFPGHYTSSIRVWVKNYRQNKTRSGQAKRLIEVRDMIQSYGGSHIPAMMRWEWTEAYLFEFLSHLRKLKLSKLPSDLREIFRYPATIPRGVVKALVRIVIPPSVETKLRQVFVRRHDHIFKHFREDGV